MDGLLDALRDCLRGPLPIAHEDQWRGGCDGGQHEPAGRRGDGARSPKAPAPIIESAATLALMYVSRDISMTLSVWGRAASGCSNVNTGLVQGETAALDPSAGQRVAAARQFR